MVKSFRYESDGFITSGYTPDEIPLDQYTKGLAKLVNLKNLSVAKNNLKSIDFAASLSVLERFTARGNYFSDISALQNLKNLAHVDLSANAIGNWNVLDGNINLTIIGR